MQVNEELVNKIATLARLEFTDDKKAEMINDMNNMLRFVDQLNAINTDGVEPLIYMNEEFNELRQDVSVVSITQDEALKNAPSHDSDYFRVPKVIEKK